MGRFTFKDKEICSEDEILHIEGMYGSLIKFLLTVPDVG